jgi:hypothetical protein
MATREEIELWSKGLAQAEFFEQLARQLRLQAEGLFEMAPSGISDDFRADLAAHIEAVASVQRQIAKWPGKWRPGQHDEEKDIEHVNAKFH